MPADLGKRALVRATLCLLNAERDKQGQPPLKLNGRLGKAAQGHARDMARNDYFSHDSQSGANFVDRIKRTATSTAPAPGRWARTSPGRRAAQASPRAIVQAWMRSAGHRANILSGSFREIGIGVAAGRTRSTALATLGAHLRGTDFGARAASSATDAPPRPTA